MRVNSRTFAKLILAGGFVFASALAAIAPSGHAQGSAAPQKRIVIAAKTILDGRGHVLHDTRIVVEGAKIVAIDAKAGPVDYDLGTLTVLPGWIDAHVHITWSFGRDGKNAGTGGATPEDAYQDASNAWVTLMAGFTTVQRGSAERRAFARRYRERIIGWAENSDCGRTAARTWRAHWNAGRNPGVYKEAKRCGRGFN